MRNEWAFALAAIVDDAGDQVVWKPDREPTPHALRLMATLGVRVEWSPVTAVSAQKLLATRDCVYPNCPREADPGTHHCRTHQAYERDLIRAIPEGPHGAARASVQEPSIQVAKQEAAAPKEAPVVQPSTSWTRETAIAAVQKFARTHGRPPGSSDLGRKNGLPSLPFAWGDKFSDLIVAAGFEPSRFGPGSKSSGRGPAKPKTAVEPEPSPVPAEAEPEQPNLSELATGLAELAPRPDSKADPGVPLAGISPLIDRLIGQRRELVEEALRLNELSVEAATKRDAIYQLVNQLEELAR